MWEEFKKFAIKGNVIDLAVAVVIGAAFGAIVASFVNDIIMPIVGVLIAGVNFADLKIVLAAAKMVNGKEVPEAAILYGKLIQTIIQFVIIAFSVFLVVKFLNHAKEKMDAKKAAEAAAAAAAPAAPPPKTDDILLLEEIRDLLKKG